MRFAFVALALLSFSCGPKYGPWHADESFADEERRAIIDGERWIAERVDEEPAGVVFDVAHPADDDPGAAGQIIRRPGWGGYCNHENGVIYIGVLFLHGEYEPTAALAAHELGHWRGLHHHDGPGVMNPLAADFRWTAEDQSSCVEAGVCGASK